MARSRDQATQRASARVDAADAFFLANDRPRFPQVIGGLALLDTSRGAVTLAEVRAQLAAALPAQPWLRRRLEQPAHGLRRPRWVEAGTVDVTHHVQELQLPAADPAAAARRTMAELVSVPFPRDRPPWRLLLLRGLAPHQEALIILMHHAVADGIALLPLIFGGLGLSVEPGPLPRPEAGVGAPPPPPAPSRPPVRHLVRGLRELAADGRPGPGPYGQGLTSSRQFATLPLPAEEVRAVGRAAGGGSSDVVLTALATAVERVERRAGRPLRRPLRIAVPVSSRPRDALPLGGGNRTGALFLPVPLQQSPTALLAEVARTRRQRQASDRVAAGAYVVQAAAGVLPAPLLARFARASYTGRLFHAIASILPGPAEPLWFGSATVTAVYPVLPLAERVGLAVGALSWAGTLGVGITAADATGADAEAIAAAMAGAWQELRRLLD